MESTNNVNRYSSNYKEGEGSRNEIRVMEGAGAEVYYGGDVGS